ncbi:VOC family protein [Rhodoplanes sp. TEM]|uniref:VOC family protein n=1 Tax=Rhodoplanes tepidamans TaxID=200616 RepID=A0ABT5J367_RHOTP|nr:MULTISPECIES: VOC family protein [Rhodoplanes]MDC7784123.1 VOC family protein [Rhodoplanes tepidamans]MDC7983218.1 VOC family protein [Rhodoplanes sp. TEM]MDQ0356780.1 glyoxalase family protein [Rhodoplanes tepidamans]
MAHGIHHVTIMAGRAHRNLDVYTRTLGLRLVKKTVNFDDPSTYHFYYGDETGRPGTIVTFFPWEHAAPGQSGVGETIETALRIPESAVAFWTHRLVEAGLRHEAPEKRFGETVIRFRDPDGTRLALVGVPGIEREPAWSSAEIPAEVAIRGVHSVGLLVADTTPTAAILTDALGFEEVGRDAEADVLRYRSRDAAAGMPGTIVDLHQAAASFRRRLGAGSVHHVAFRAADDAAQAAMVARLASEHGIRTTEQRDRNYFRSVYFREPGGVLFEIATDVPGFAVDEPVAALGTALKLPARYEPRRAAIEAALPQVA